ncbi:hypothetical protein BS47DRAFT_1355496, partial [Hydnum rufescens UP504]
MAPQATFVPFMDLSSSKPPHFSNNAARIWNFGINLFIAESIIFGGGQVFIHL